MCQTHIFEFSPQKANTQKALPHFCGSLQICAIGGIVYKSAPLGGIVHFKKDSNVKNVFLSEDIDLFINDALNYKKYLKNNFNDVDIDVDI